MSTLGGAMRFLAGALAEAADAWSDPALLRSFLRDLGWTVESIPPQLTAVGAPAAALADTWRTAQHSEVTPEQIARLAEEVRALWLALSALDTMPEPPGLTDFATDLGRTILDYWIVEALERYGWISLPLLELFGIVEVRHVDDAPPRRAHFRRKVHWDRLPGLLEDPAAGFRDRYGWGTPAFAADEVLSRIRELLLQLRWSAALIQPNADELAAGGAPLDVAISGVELQLLAGERSGARVEAGVRFLPLARPGIPPGLGLVPYFSPGLGAQFPLDDHVAIALDASFDVQGGVILSWLPTQGLELRTDLHAPGGGTTRATGHAALRMLIDDPAKTEKHLVDVLGFQLVARTAQGAVLVELEPEPSFAIEAEIKDGLVRWDSSKAPGVLARLFGDRSFEAAAAIGLGWSSRRGFYLRGGTTLGTVIPTDVVLGPVRLRGIRVALEPLDAGVALVLGVDGEVAIGPVTIDWQGLGVKVGVQRGAGENDPIDLAFDASAPTMIGLRIDTPLVAGGGSIRRVDADRYAGELSLRALGVEVRALASVARVDGATSVAAIIAARWPGVPIGLGFLLEGMTGVIGIDRRVDDEACRARLRTGGVAALLSGGGDPAAALDALEAVFPVAAGRYLVGLGPTIGWGSPRILRADLVLLLELPSPVRVILLASARLGLPTLAKPVVDLRLDAIGVLDFDRRTFALDASLHDSSLAGYELTGDLALRTAWGDDPAFVLSIGGFHPRFAPPPGFPALRRVALTAGDQPQLRLEAYLALTSNTAQIGAQADLTYEESGFSIAAHVGFDALFELSPFHFEVDISASASITWHGHRLLSVELDFLLEGPRPWHAKGDASFGVLWWDVSVGFDVTWGNAAPLPLPPPPDLAAELRTALGRADAWTSELPAGERAWIAIADRPPVAGVVKVHPLAAVTVRERILPLDYDVTQFGSVPLAAPRRFAITGVTVGPRSPAAPKVDDVFAPAQFTRMSPEERLAAPAFERHGAGVRIGDGEVAHGPVARVSMDEDTILVDPLAVVTKPPRQPIAATHLGAILAHHPTRPRPEPTPRGPRVRDLEFVLASAEDLTLTAAGAAIAGEATTYSALRERLRRDAGGRAAAFRIVPRPQAG
jgi:hypothetical protein